MNARPAPSIAARISSRTSSMASGPWTAAAMTHIAIQERLDGKPVDSMDQVSDEQYLARR